MDSSSTLSGDGPSREEWSEISLVIAQGLEQVRNQWFIWLFPSRWWKRTTLSGEAAHATKAWQLYIVSAFLAHHRYIPPSKGRDFADLLYAQVCGTELPECLSFHARYHEMAGDRAAELGRFSLDISRCISPQDAPSAKLFLVASTLPRFTDLIHLVVAAAFGDSDTVSQLQAKLSPSAE